MFLRCFLTLAKVRPHVSYKNVSYKKTCVRLLYNYHSLIVTVFFRWWWWKRHLGKKWRSIRGGE